MPETLSAAPAQRIQAIDLARGLAVCLMILSHGVNGLLDFDQFTSWGLVPVHATTKIASSLFIMVFGIALAVAFVPHTGDAEWPRRRHKLLLRGVLVLFWYKLLTIVEMAPTHPPGEVLDALLYRRFPSYVEILGFYAIALLWMPFALPLWPRLPRALRVASPLLALLLAWLVARLVDFGTHHQLQALLIEHEDHYTWGQLSRLPLVLLGLLIGGWLLDARDRTGARLRLAALLAAAGALLLLAFAIDAGPALVERLEAIARNAGKHPPELRFMLFSLGGALLALGIAIAGGEGLARLLAPVTVVGTDALKAFVFHIFVIFVLLRWLLGYLHAVSYMHALLLTLALILATAAWIKLTSWVHARA